RRGRQGALGLLEDVRHGRSIRRAGNRGRERAVTAVTSRPTRAEICMRLASRLAAAAILVIAVTACGTPVALRTAPKAEAVCMSALMGGVLTPSARSGLGVRPAAGNNALVEVLWPFGYSATRSLDGKLTLLDASGKEIAHEGETI